MISVKIENPAGASATGSHEPLPLPGATRVTRNVEAGLVRFYHGVKGMSERTPAETAYEVLMRMEDQLLIDWTIQQNAFGLTPGYPCPLVAFASCLPHPKHIEYFYQRLMCNGLMDLDDLGPPGGVTLVGMLNALQQWEAWHAGKTRAYPIRGMDVHHIKCKGSAIVDFAVCHTTTLKGTKLSPETNIIFVEDLDAKTGHFVSAKGFRKNGGYDLLMATVSRNTPLLNPEAPQIGRAHV